MSRTATTSDGIVFRVAAGSRQGFGHLVRARVLARALGIRRPLVSVRGRAEAADVAARLGFRVAPGSPSQLLDEQRPRVVVIDDPTASQARVWTRAAKGRGIRTVSIHDLGRGYCGADLSVDGSLVRARWPKKIRSLTGPRYAILDPRLRRAKGKTRDPKRILIALGGGPRIAVAARVAEAITKRRPGVNVRVAAGFLPGSVKRVPGVTWLAPQQGLAVELARCGAALVGGGVSLYEATAVGTPTAVWPVVSAQLPTARAFVQQAGVIGVWTGRARTERAAAAVCELLDRRPIPAAVLDGLGAARVAEAILAMAAQSGGTR